MLFKILKVTIGVPAFILSLILSFSFLSPTFGMGEEEIFKGKTILLSASVLLGLTAHICLRTTKEKLKSNSNNFLFFKAGQKNQQICYTLKKWVQIIIALLLAEALIVSAWFGFWIPAISIALWAPLVALIISITAIRRFNKILKVVYGGDNLSFYGSYFSLKDPYTVCINPLKPSL